MGDKVLILLISFSTFFYFVNVVLSCIAGATEGVIFKHRTGDVSNRRNTFVTPSGWTFMIWNLIFLTVGASMIYLAWNIRRASSNGLGKVYCNPAVFSKGAAIAFLVNQVTYIAWLFVWDQEHMTGAAILLLAIMATNWTTLGLMAKNLFEVTGFLSSASPKDLWLYRILVLNSFGMYTAWTTLATHLNAAIAFVYDAGTDNQTTSLIVLCALMALVVAWFALDIFYLDKFTRYLVFNYLTLIWGLTGIQVKLIKLSTTPTRGELDDKIPVMHFVSALLALMVLLTFAKVSVLVYRHIKKPLSEMTLVPSA